MLAPGAHDSQAFYELRAVFNSEFVPIPLARVRDEVAHLGVVA